MRAWTISLVLVGIAGASARADDDHHDRSRLGDIELRSSAFSSGGEIPRAFTCDGAEQTPPLEWSHVPQDTRSIAILVEDLDAPKGSMTHWLVTGIPPEVRSLPAGGGLPDGAVADKNGTGREGWMGPCPPTGTHHYAFHVFALDRMIDRRMSRADFEAVLDRHAIARGEIIGVYRRDDRDHYRDRDRDRIFERDRERDREMH